MSVYIDLEVWLIGSPHELATATAALRQAGRIVAASNPEPLHGADAGRIRRYLRVSVRISARTPARPAPARTPAGQGAIELTSRRTA